MPAIARRRPPWRSRSRSARCSTRRDRRPDVGVRGGNQEAFDAAATAWSRRCASAAARSTVASRSVEHDRSEIGLRGGGVARCRTALSDRSLYTALVGGGVRSRLAIDRCVERIDLASDYVVLAWPVINQLSERTLYTRLSSTAAPACTAGRSPACPGAGGRLFQILLAPVALDRLAGVYVSTRERSTRSKPAARVAAAIAGPLLAAIAAQQGTIALRQEALSTVDAPAAPAWASVSRVDLPFRRAAVHVELRASVAPAAAAIQWRRGARHPNDVRRDAPRSVRTELAAQLPRCSRRSRASARMAASSCVELADVQFSSRYAAAAAALPGAERRRDATEPAGAAARRHRVPDVRRRARPDGAFRDTRTRQCAAVTVRLRPASPDTGATTRPTPRAPRISERADHPGPALPPG